MRQIQDVKVLKNEQDGALLVAAKVASEAEAEREIWHTVEVVLTFGWEGDAHRPEFAIRIDGKAIAAGELPDFIAGR